MARKRMEYDDDFEDDRVFTPRKQQASGSRVEVHRPEVKKKQPVVAAPPVRKKIKPTSVNAVPPPPSTPQPSSRTTTPVKKLATPRKEVVQYTAPPESELEEEEEDEEDEGEEEEEEEIAAPVVFQCGTCRSIFGDSYAFVCSNAELLLVTLSAVTNVSRSVEATTSRDGADSGSSFHELLCKQCQTILGRQYLTTTRALDAIRGLYSFSTNAIASYQLGYPQLSQVENGTSDVLPTMDEIKRANQQCDEAVQLLSMDRKELLKLREDMSKVQSLLVVVDARLHQLETQADDSEEEGEEEEGNQRQHQQQRQEQLLLTPKQQRAAHRHGSPEV